VGTVSIGPVAIGFAGRLKIMCGLSCGQTHAVVKEVLKFPVHRSTLCRALARLARRAEPTYQPLIESVTDRADPGRARGLSGRNRFYF